MALSDVAALARNWRKAMYRAGWAVLFTVVFAAAMSVSLESRFGLYVAVDGALGLGFALTRKKRLVSPSLALEGLFGLVAGGVAFTFSGTSGFVWVVLCWALASTVVKIATATTLRRLVAREWLLLLGALNSIGLAVVLLLVARSDAALGGALALYSLIAGVLNLLLAMRLRSWCQRGAIPLRFRGVHGY